MPKTISIYGKRANASAFCSNLILDGRNVIFLTAYGPTQEIRAFIHLLTDGESRLENENNEVLVRKVLCPSNPVLIPKFDNGYTGLYLVSSQVEKYIVADTDAECFDIYSRYLDQQQFIHRSWYKELFDLAEVIPPQIGNKHCCHTVADVARIVQENIDSGKFAFPPATAHLQIDTGDKKSENQP